MSNIAENSNWTWIIRPKKGWFDLELKEVFKHKDLLVRFIRREFLGTYQQTILGPVWIFLQPLLTAFVYILIFGRVARGAGDGPPDGLPNLIFYLSGIIIWNFFSESIILTSYTYINNVNIFGKVYFPRIITATAMTLAQFIKFAIQLGLFLLVYIFFMFKEPGLRPNEWLLLLPVALINTTLLSLGLGIFFASLTAKYRDLHNLMLFGIRLFMFVTPVLLPMSFFDKHSEWKWIIVINPLTPIMQVFRQGLGGNAVFDGGLFLYSTIVSIFIFMGSVLVFNKIDEKVMDVV
jgi:lipopolysaccharide transport system permease protein